MKKKVSCILLLLLIISSMCPLRVAANDKQNNKNDRSKHINTQEIDQLVQKIMRKSKVPGLSIVITGKDDSSYLNYGYADIEKQSKVESDTYFELGSMSKAYTALGILLLEDEGRINLDDDVTKYLPWFKAHYEGMYEKKHVDEDVSLKISNFLYHTTGIPYETVGYIPEGTSDDMLEKTVRGLSGANLCFYPGQKYLYATANYDVLGLIIQTVSGMPYEKFMEERIFQPLELNHTFFSKTYPDRKLASGYKLEFFHVKKYDAPRYAGNDPAGYVVSNAKDMDRWIRIQLGMVALPEQFQRIIKKSHIGNSTVAPDYDLYYAAGWMVHIRGKYIQHGGNNPNYSNMVVMEPDNNIGICILSNLDTNAAEYLATNILSIIEDRKIDQYKTDSYMNLDTVFSSVLLLSIVLSLFFTVLLIKAIIEWIQKKREVIHINGVKVANIALILPILLFMGFCFYYLPNILVKRIPWYAVNVWGPLSIKYGCIICYIACIIFMIYVSLDFNVAKKNGHSYIPLVFLSLLNGIGSALIIFTINESFNRKLEYSKELLVYFIFSLVFFVYTLKLTEGRMIVITNEISYEKKTNLLHKILHSTYQSIETIGGDRIHSCLNNDCNDIARIPSIVVNIVSNSLTLLFCLGYLFVKSKYTFFASLTVVVLNLCISIITGKIAAKYWDKNRNIQDIYFGQIHDLIAGFKELVLNTKRRLGFEEDIVKYARKSTELNKTASLKVLNYELYNAFMYNVVFGVVVFLFPMLIYDIDVNQLRENLFIVFYLIGPFGVVANNIPQLSELKIKMNRIQQLSEDLQEKVLERSPEDSQEMKEIQAPITLTLQDINYTYTCKDEDDVESEFVLGPISLTLKSGEITFITGGNGSGKSTLGKLLCGLYIPKSGKILVNGEEVSLSTLNELYAAVYTDFNIFEKLYGIDGEQVEDKFKEYLQCMEIDKKVKWREDGVIESKNLSTGQKKRLAFVISCLEDKPMLVYDEWAAEQDPNFRKYFYETILPMLKKQNKGVIVITHDDRYFDLADHFIKLERGTLVDDIVR